MASLSALFSESSVPGLANIANTGGIRRILWLLAFLILSGFTCNDLYNLFSDYLTYPVTVNIKVADSRLLPFPAVTICNLNPIQKDNFCSSTNLKKPVLLEKLLCANIANLMSNQQCKLPDLATQTCFSRLESFLLGKKRKKRQLNQFSGGALDDLTELITKLSGLDKLGLGNVSDVKNVFTSGNITSIVKTIAPLFRKTMQETTGCNLGTSEVPKELVDLLKNMTSSLKNPICLVTPDGLKMLGSLAENLKDQLTTCASSIMNEFKLSADGENPFWALTNSLKSFLFELERTNWKKAKELGQSWENLILSCMYEGKDCRNSSLFIQVFYSSYGNCYTFNFHENDYRNRNRKKIKMSGFTGPRYGLELQLNINTSQYMPTTKEAGAKIIIHSPTLRADVDQDAIHIPPGVVTYIGVKMVNITRLPSPHTDKCNDDWLNDELKKWAVNLNYGYTAQTCLKFCFQKKVIENCNCFTTSAPIPNFYGLLSECDFRIPGNRTCLEKINKIYYDGDLGCDCPPRCSEISYQKAVSTGKETKQCQLLKDPNEKETSQVTDDSEKAKVVIYFQSMSYQEIAQEPKYSFPNLIGSAGGILGMYIGFSFLVVFEIVEVLLRSCLGKIKKRSNIRNQAGSVSTVEAFARGEKKN
ncbi:degenerin-like protein unc-105 isoform X2 [Tachypleus tridentatus]|uniref:degenerin-like protein unc-105 isoform X2 n=1 Tax=Tachypleus tridentatus TaxID=6853 RepID=UPI003FD47CC3